MGEILPGDEIAVITPSSSSPSPTRATASETTAPTAPCSSSTMADANHNPPQYSSFSTGQKRLIVTMVTLASFFSPLSSQIYYPIMPTLVQTYDLTPALINLTITSYMLLQGLAPAFMGTFADACGRRPAYMLSFTIYTVANIGLALQTNYPALMVLRCLQSAGSSGTVAFGYGVISDIATPAERGMYVGPMSAGTMLGPALGPAIGGLLARYFGWRSVFWFLVIVSGGFLVCFWALVPETARGVVGDGCVIPGEWWRLSGVQLLKQRRRKKNSTDGIAANVESGAVERDADEKDTGEINPTTSTTKLRFLNPIKTLAILLEPDALILISSIGLLMITNAALLTSTPTLFKEIWDLNDLQIGLCFIPLGTGASLGAIVNGYVLNENYRRHYQRHAHAEAPSPGSTAPAAINLNSTSPDPDPDPESQESTRSEASKFTPPFKSKNPPLLAPTFPIEKSRLQLSFPTLCLTIVALVPYGFVLQSRTHLSAPLTLHFLNGFATVACTNTLNILLVDLFPDRPATATAACNLVRCLLGALGAGTVEFMLESMGWRGCFAFLGGCLMLASLLAGIEYRIGGRWREARQDITLVGMENVVVREKEEGGEGRGTNENRDDREQKSDKKV
ncbi:major facilitator superfamily domain-containing protein [Aspergillus venezuelensis]